MLAGETGIHGEVQRLTKSENQRLWRIMVGKINNLYGKSTAHLKGKGFGLPDLSRELAERADRFIELPIAKQIKALFGLVVGCGCNASAFDLSAFSANGKDDSTVSTIQPAVAIKFPLTLVYQSVTGIKEHRIVICEGLDEQGNPIYPAIKGKENL